MTLRGAVVAICAALLCSSCGGEHPSSSPKDAGDPTFKALVVPCFASFEKGGKHGNWDGWKIDGDRFEMDAYPNSNLGSGGIPNLRCAMDGLGIAKAAQDKVFESDSGDEYDPDSGYSLQWSSAYREPDGKSLIGEPPRLTVTLSKG